MSAPKKVMHKGLVWEVRGWDRNGTATIRHYFSDEKGDHVTKTARHSDCKAFCDPAEYDHAYEGRGY
jgi:hypothetical protein